MAAEVISGTRLSVGAPYFDTVFPPLMLPLVALLVVGPLARWRVAALGAVKPLLPLAFLVAGIALFGYLVEESGLLSAVFVLSVMIGYGDLRRHPVQVIGLALALSVGATLVFVQFLGMPIRPY